MCQSKSENRLKALAFLFYKPHSVGKRAYKKIGADDEARTRYLHLGKVALYQMSYIRKYGAFGRNRTIDTRIFSPLLYRLSYKGKFGDPERVRTVDL